MDHVAQIRMRTWITAVSATTCFLFAATLGAQGTGTIIGVVTDSTGAPIIGAEVSVASRALRDVTDERGEYRLGGTLDGQVSLTARRLGFVPQTLNVSVSSQSLLRQDIRLARAPIVLPPVAIRTQRVDYTGRLAGYYQRLQSHSGGYFISRDEIDKAATSKLTQLLTHVPAISMNRMRGGGSGVRMRQRNCWPLVWIDGLPMGAGEVDLDAFPPSTIQGIELYLGSTTAPMRYQADREQSSCGTILLWSRGPDTDPVLPPSANKWDFDRMVASLTIFTPDQVDKPALPDNVHPIDVKYPPALFAAGVKGSVLAEFVVDAKGKIEYQTLGIVSSTHPLFSDAVRRALENAQYTPAVRRGVAVRQLVQQPFDFMVANGKMPGA
ncbi:MAG TPA: TonB family protein [Gemmatimonadaceae bacterium]|nr:TonB family protein [Gemmatimonadaceae bacterium]